MKELDKNKAYDYSNLSEPQLEELKAHMVEHHGFTNGCIMRYNSTNQILYWDKGYVSWMYNPERDYVFHNIVNARELFDQSLEDQLKEAEAKVEEIKNLIKQRDEPKLGDVCKFYDEDSERFVISKLKRVEMDSTYPYETPSGDTYTNIKKLTKEEVLKELGYE